MANGIPQVPSTPATAAKCYLLNLPGELRNRVYHFAREDGPITYCSNRLKLRTKAEVENYGVKKTLPSFRGFTQTCRQIRQEFSPLYAADMEFHVCHVDLKEYMGIGLPYLSRDGNGKIFGNLFIDCKAFLVANRPGRATFPEPAIQICPLLELCRDNPNLRVRCGDHNCSCPAFEATNRAVCKVHWAELAGDLHALFKTAQDPVLGDAFVEAVVSLSLSHTLQATVSIKKDKFEDWVAEKFDADNVYGQALARTGFELSLRTVARRERR